MFRAVYKAAAAFTDVAGADGKKARNSVFNTNRGVLQGDVTSPLFFILALELIMRRHDSAGPDKGVTLASTMIHVLGCADDVAVLEPGTQEGIHRLENRVTSISRGSEQDADMCLNTDKTKTLHVTEQNAVTKTTAEEARSICKLTCPHLNCGFKFLKKAGLRVHAGSCEWKDGMERRVRSGADPESQGPSGGEAVQNQVEGIHAEVRHVRTEGQLTPQPDKRLRNDQ